MLELLSSLQLADRPTTSPAGAHRWTVWHIYDIVPVWQQTLFAGRWTVWACKRTANRQTCKHNFPINLLQCSPNRHSHVHDEFFFLAAEIYTCRLLNLCARNLIVHTALNSCPCAIILFAHDYIFTRQFLHKHNLSYCCYRLVYNLLNHGLFLVL